MMDEPKMTKAFTPTEFAVLLQLLDARASLAAEIASHPNDRPRNERLRSRAQEDLFEYRSVLVEGF